MIIFNDFNIKFSINYNKITMKFNLIVLLIASAAALKIREEPAAEGAAKAPPTPPAAVDDAKEAKDADWQNPYGHVAGMGQFEGKLSDKITSKTTTYKERDEAEAKKANEKEPEVAAGTDITSEAKAD